VAGGVIDRRDNGRYRARYEGPDRRWRSRTFDRKGDASRWLAAQLTTISRGEWIDPNAGLVPFADVAWGWLEAKTRIKDKTREGYRSLLTYRILPTFGNARVTTINRAMVGSWVQAMSREGLSPSRIRQAHQCLSAILEQAADDSIIGRNPARRVELPRLDQPEHRFLTAEQVARLAEAMPDSQSTTMVCVLAYGGLRWGELVAVRRGRVDVLRRRIEIAEAATEISGRLVFGTPKGHTRRTAHLPRFVAELLARHLGDVGSQPDTLVFTSPEGGALRSSNVRRRIWDPACVAAGDDLAGITPHDLRHTCASLMRAAGADVKAIQQQLGHRTATVTLDTYTHLFEGDLADVMDRLDTERRIELHAPPAMAEVVELSGGSESPTP
jgi:integrase